MGRCGLCGKLLDGNNVVMYPVNVGSSNIDVADVSGGTFYAGNASQTRNVPCCIKCVERKNKIAIESSKQFFTGFLKIIFLWLSCSLLLYFLYLIACNFFV